MMILGFTLLERDQRDVHGLGRELASGVVKAVTMER